MSVTKRIVCLANSRKLEGRCLAGRELTGGQPGLWIRPVSNRPNEEVSEYERQYLDGSDPKVLDIINVPLLEARPRDYQQENWLLDPKQYWVRQGKLSWQDLSNFQEQHGHGPLWINSSSSYSGKNDRIPLAEATALRSSLKFIRVTHLEVRVFAPGEAFGNAKRRVQARFSFDRSPYWLWVTDPGVERQYLAQENGSYQVGESYLTVSLGEPHDDGYCYKLVAAVIRRT